MMPDMLHRMLGKAAGISNMRRAVVISLKHSSVSLMTQIELGKDTRLNTIAVGHNAIPDAPRPCADGKRPDHTHRQVVHPIVQP